MEKSLIDVHGNAITTGAKLQSTVSWLSTRCRLSQRPTDSGTERDEVAQAFKPWLPAMFGTVASTGAQSEQVRPVSACQGMLEPAAVLDRCPASAVPRSQAAQPGSQETPELPRSHQPSSTPMLLQLCLLGSRHPAAVTLGRLSGWLH